MSITFSIVTPSLNQSQFIEQTIKSVLSQEGNFFIDYIIVDACSTDDSVEIIKKYAYLLESGEWNVRCLGIEFRWVSEADRGQSDGINKGFRIARGDLFCWLNSDDLYPPGLLNTVAKVSWSNTDFIYGKGVWIDGSGEELGVYPTFPPNKYTLSITCTICQPTVFFTKEAFETLGSLSTEYDLVFDYEYWLRAVHTGMQFRYHPEILVKSRMYTENKTCSMIVTGERERRKLFDQYTTETSFIDIVAKNLWGIIIKNRTRKRTESMMKIVQSGGVI